MTKKLCMLLIQRLLNLNNARKVTEAVKGSSGPKGAIRNISSGNCVYINCVYQWRALAIFIFSWRHDKISVRYLCVFPMSETVLRPKKSSEIVSDLTRNLVLHHQVLQLQIEAPLCCLLGCSSIKISLGPPIHHHRRSFLVPRRSDSGHRKKKSFFFFLSFAGV